MRRTIGLLLGLTLLASCRHAPSSSQPASSEVRLYLESAAPGGTVWVLPQSGVRIACAAQPVVDSGAVAGLEVVSLELGTGVLLRLKPEGAAALASLAPTANSRRLVLVIDGAALGAVRLNHPPTDGRIVLFVEKADAELPALVESVNQRLGGWRKFLRL